MKHKTLIQLRDADFVECLRSVAGRYEKDRRTVSPEIIIAEAIASRPRRYYLSFTTVHNTLSRLRSAGTLSVAPLSGSVNSRCQWIDINRAVSRYLALHKGASLADAISYVVNFSRPDRFYISDRKARELFRRTLRREYHYVG